MHVLLLLTHVFTLDPYRMVIVSLLTSCILILGILFYRYIFPKKKINLFILLILISLLPVINIFRSGAYQSGDFDIHIYRTISFYQSLSEGIILPSWAGNLNATYGYPLFIFNYPFPYYLLSFNHFIGFSYIMSMKLFLATTFIASGIFMYFAAKELFKKDIAAFTAAIFYLFTPYHLIDQNFKIVIGELLVFVFLPLTFLFLQKSLKKGTFHFILLTGIATALLILAHVVIALYLMVLLFCYSIFFALPNKRYSYIIVTVLSFILGVFLTLYIWITPFLLSKYTIIQKMHFGLIDAVPFSQLFFSPWRMGLLFQGPQGEISDLLGYTQLFILTFFVIILLLKKIPKVYKNHIQFWVVATVIICFLTTSYSKFIWNVSPLLAYTGVHRLFVLFVFCIAILSGYFALLYQKKRKMLFILIFITIFITILNWGQRTVLASVTDSALTKNLPLSTAHGEGHFYANSIYRDPKNEWFTQIPKNHLEIIKGSGLVKEISRTSTKHMYVIDAKNPLLLQENTLYFPGWQISMDNKIVPIGHDNEGVITFKLPKGLHLVEVTYRDLPLYGYLRLINTLLLVLAIIYVFFRWITDGIYRNSRSNQLTGFAGKNK